MHNYIDVYPCNKLAKRKKKKPEPILDWGRFYKIKGNSSKFACGRWKGNVIRVLQNRYPKHKDLLV